MQSFVFKEIDAHADRLESVKYPEPQRVFATNYEFSLLSVIGINTAENQSTTTYISKCWLLKLPRFQ